MTVRIALQLEAFDCLASYMPKGSNIYTACRNFKMIFGPDGRPSVEMRCDETQLDVLLGIAKQHCPDAVQQIQEALIKSSRSGVLSR
jgi:hypothetical protein